MSTDHRELFQPRPPTFYVTDLNDDAFTSLSLDLALRYPDNDVVVLSGAKATSLARFFAEIDGVLPLPDYFGENWNALNDVLYEQSWLPGWLFMVSDAQLLLAEEPPEHLGLLLRLFDKCNAKHLVPEQDWDDHQNGGFHVLFQCSGDARRMLVEHLGVAGVAFADL